MADSQKKTANMFSSSFTDGYSLNANGLPQAFEGRIATLVPIAINAENCTLSYRTSKNTNFIFAVINNGTLVRRVAGKSNGDTIDTSGGDTLYICIYESLGQGIEASEVSEIMLNEGSTALPYEPYSSTGWLHSLRKLTTATEAVENPLYSDGTPITAYTLKGNEEHTGTPTPSNPVDVNGVGVRTENLFDKDNATVIGSYIAPETGVLTYSTTSRSVVIPCQANTTYTLSKTKGSRFTVGCYDSNPSNGDTATNWTANSAATSITITTTANSQYLVVFFYYAPSETETYEQVLATLMLNTGSTAKSYEPYGYKIPISSGGVTTNIYLGSTQTVRQVQKYVLTGNETVRAYDTTYERIFVEIPVFVTFGNRVTPIISTHYQGIYDGRPIGDVPMNSVYSGSYGDYGVYITEDSYTSSTDFKGYLTAQYAAGTPVTVWYVLATPETAAVNEPLMKIGDYVDTLSNAASIPTTEGANSITVDTDVQPSEFTATWTGWHDSSVKEYDGSDW